ncbi:tetratricopeptide repeat protein [bacterium]|nr:tetratricopeptide repeat protein [bacterium]
MNLAERASDKERLYIESSHARLIENDREKEARLLEQLVSKYPQEKLAYWCLGVNYRSEGLYGRALAALGEALSLDPGYAPALNSIAYAYADSNDFERAFAYFERYATMTPLDANPYDSMADIHVRMGDLDVALGKYEQAIALRPDFFASHAKIWYLHGLNENYDRALQSLDRFINSTSTPAIKGHGFKWRGFCDFWLGKRDTCLYELRLSADLAPDEVAKSLTDYILGWVYLHLGEIETGRRYCDSAIEVFNRGATPGRRALHGTLQAYFHGLSFLQADDTAAARTCLEQLEARLAEVEPVYSPTLEHCARCLRAEVMLAEGDPERAAAIFRTARRYALDHIHDVTIVPLNLSRQDVAARAYLASGDTAQAIAEYERLVSANANERGRLFVEPRDHYRLGVLYQDAGRLAEAAAEFGKFVEIWKDARPMPADMVDAGNRLEGMKRIPAG